MTNVSQRINEAKRVGFQRCFIAAQRGAIAGVEGIEVIQVHHVREAVNLALS